MVRLSPRLCISTKGHRWPATALSRLGSRRPPLTSLIQSAPAARAASATSPQKVSMERIACGWAARMVCRAGSKRPSSVSAPTSAAPGRVLWAPRSSTSAPWRRRRSAWRRAASAPSQRPPSLKESGVRLITPMTPARWPHGKCIAVVFPCGQFVLAILPAWAQGQARLPFAAVGKGVNWAGEHRCAKDAGRRLPIPLWPPARAHPSCPSFCWAPPCWPLPWSPAFQLPPGPLQPKLPQGLGRRPSRGRLQGWRSRRQGCRCSPVRPPSRGDMC